MNIAYIFLSYGSPVCDGVVQKVISQADMWQRAGHRVKFFLCAHKKSEFYRYVLRKGFFDFEYEIIPYTSNLFRIVAERKIAKKANKFGDIVYFRFGLYWPFFLFTINKKFIAEVNSDLLFEQKCKAKGKFNILYSKVCEKKIFHKIGGAIFVSNELKETYFTRCLDLSAMVIANGISLTNFRKKKINFDEKVRLFFIGSPGKRWHGLDKIIHLAAMIPEYHFDVVGIIAEAFGEIVTPNVKFHGMLRAKDYIEIARQSLVAISTLALHRNEMKECSSLKTREYLALGLPVILAAEDTDFMDKKYPFILNLPNIEDNIISNIAKIKEFVDYWKYKYFAREEIAHIDVKYKETKRLEFFVEIKEENKK